MRLQRAKPKAASSTPPPEDVERPKPAEPDLSVLRKSVATSVHGLAEACGALEKGTTELRQLLTAECDIIYECKVCRNLFRSLANFISHKRVYCCKKFDPSLHPHFGNNNCAINDLNIIMQNEEDYQNFIKTKENEDVKSKARNFKERNSGTAKDLTSIIERLIHRKDICSGKENLAKIQHVSGSQNIVYVTPVSNTSASHESLKDQVVELEKMISSNEAVLGPDGKLISCCSSTVKDPTIKSSSSKDDVTEENMNDLFCGICKTNFSTLKTKKFHMKHKHSNNRLVYPCSECSDTFSNSWSVIRHLVKVHRKSAAHVRKLRDTIHNKAFKLDTTIKNVEVSKPSETPSDPISEQQRMDQENQAWIENLEADGDIPRCGGCGKRFERRAALSAHRQTCQLRKSAQNKINSNIQRKTKNKEQEELTPLEPAVKVVKVEKPVEKRIEIKIRKDYNKPGPTGTPESSLCAGEDEDRNIEEDADSATQSLQFHDTDLQLDLGENKCDVSSTVSLNNISVHDNLNCENTVKDYDDANVDMHFEKHSPEIAETDKSIEMDNSVANVENISLKSVNNDVYQESTTCIQDHTTVSSFNSELFAGVHIKQEKPDYDEYQVDASLPLSEKKLELDYSSTFHQCTYCSSTFIEKVKLDRHVARHLIWLKYECKICGVKSCNNAQYEKHMKTQHGSSGSTAENLDQSVDGSIPPNLIKTEIKEEVDNDTDYELPSKKTKNKAKLKNITKRKNILKKIPNAVKTTGSISQETPNIDMLAKLSQVNEATTSLDGKSSTGGDIILSTTEDPKTNRIKRKKLNQHIVSSESCTVRRPVRNRVKNVDKDFEYDSPYFSKIKTEHTESIIPTELKHKIPLKRKFLQSEEDITQTCQDAFPATISNCELISQNQYAGALQTFTYKMSSQGRGPMRTKETPKIRQSAPPFMRVPRISARPSLTVYNPITPPLTASQHGTEMTAPPLKTKAVPPSCTALKTSKKSSLEVGQKKARSGSELSLNKTELLLTTEKNIINSSRIQKRKSSAIQVQKSSNKPQAKIDPQVPNKCTYNSEEITVISKSHDPLHDIIKKNDDSSVDSLSILPSNDKTHSSFVNISLKQLKNLQKNEIPIQESSQPDLLTKSVSALKNLEGKEEIKILKVCDDGLAISDDYSLHANKNLIHKSMAKTFQKTLSKTSKKPKMEKLKTTSNNPVDDIVIDANNTCEHLSHDGDDVREHIVLIETSDSV